MGRWFVQLDGARMDLEEFPRWFGTGDVHAVEENGTFYLTGAAFDDYADAGAVREEAQRKVQEYSAVIALLWPALQPPTVGNVEREREPGGSRDKWVFPDSATLRLKGSLSIVARAKAGLVGVTIDGVPQARVETETQAQQMFGRAARSERLRKALRLFSDVAALTPTRLGLILEEIEAHLGCEVNESRLCSSNERERFRRSINCGEVFGADARHADGKFEPPSNPMDLKQAIEFIRRLLVAVLTG